ncbi:MAG: GNAT family N-acetyltransferase [Lachnospiraceae bacterium]|nr:GNAT family N-acetyltransferase [Lachnospiraceae bacterium]
MNLSCISSKTLPVYQTLLLPESYELLTEGVIQVAIGLTEEDAACGALAGYVGNNAFHITSLFVAPTCRGKGGGRMLVEGLMKALPPEITEVGASFIITEQDHEKLQDFLEHMGFRSVAVPEPVYRIRLDELSGLSFFKDSGGKGGKGGVLSFRQIPEFAIREAGNELAATGELPFEKPLHQLELDPDLSVGIFRDEKLSSFLVFDHSFGGALTLAYASTQAPADLPALLRTAFHRAVELYPSEEPVFIQSVTETSDRLISALLEDRPPVSVSWVKSTRQ